MNITLYQFEDCPYCAKVRRELDRIGLKYTKAEMVRDRNDPTRKLLLEKSGVPTVPVIEIDGKFIGDSSAIIAYLHGLEH